MDSSWGQQRTGWRTHLLEFHFNVGPGYPDHQEVVEAAKFRCRVERRATTTADIIGDPVALLKIIKVLMSGKYAANQTAILHEELVQSVASRRIMIQGGTDGAVDREQRGVKEQKHIGLRAQLQLLLNPLELVVSYLISGCFGIHPDET